MNEPINVLTITERLYPSNILGVIKPMLKLQENGDIHFRMRYSSQFKDTDIEWCDWVVLCRSIRPENLGIIEKVKKYNKRLVYDIDDNFFELSINSAIGRFHRFPIHLYVVTEMLKNADAVRVYSEPMKEIAEEYNSNVFKLRSYFDFSLLTPKKDVQSKDKIKIVYASSRGNGDPLAQICLPAVARILQDFPNVEFYSFGKVPYPLKNIHQLKYKPNYSEYIRFFYSQNFDIGLAPLLDDRFHNSKTNNKFREYGAMGVCGVYSDAFIYRECVEDHKNGLIVENTADSWYNALKELITDETLRNTIKENARESVKKYYSMDNTLNDWRKVLSTNNDKIRLQYKNICNLKIAIVIDQDSNLSNLRINHFYQLTGFCGMRTAIFSYKNAKLSELKDYDLCVCFINSNKAVSTWISTIRNYQTGELIVDTLFPYDKAESYPNVTFTNVTKQTDNSFQIDDVYSLTGVNAIASTMSEMVVNEKTDSFSEIYSRSNKSILSNEEKVFSINSPVYKWAELLSRFDTKFPKKKRSPFVIAVIKCGEKLLFIIKRIAYILRKIWVHTGQHLVDFMCRIYDKISWGLVALSDYIKVNYRKKY